MALPDGLPRLTLGWGVLDWCTNYLAHPDGDNMGSQWIFTNEQARFVLWYYAVNAHGEFEYRRAVLERPKGWGKSPFVATLAAAELLGPVKFDGLAEKTVRGERQVHAIGRPQPSSLIQVAAISEAQVENSYAPLMEMLGQGKAQAEYRLDIGLTRILASRGRKIEKVTASPRSREGRQTTFAVLDETHLWVPSEHGHELAAVLRRNLAKKDGRSIETTNAHVPGQDSVAEASHNYAIQIESGLIEEKGLLFDSRRTTCENIYDRDQLFPALNYVYGDAVWVPKQRIWREINDPANTEADMRRFYLNELHRGDTQWFKPAEWEKCKRDDIRPLKKGDKIALGFKGATRKGAAALVACRLTDGALFLLNLWEQPDPTPRGWEVPYQKVDKAVRSRLKKLHQHCLLVADPWQYQDIVGRWAVDFEDTVEEFWLSQKLNTAKAVDSFAEAVYAERITHGGDANLSRHVLNCHREKLKDEPDSPYIVRPATPKQYIGAAQAAILAFEAAQLSIEAGALTPEEPGDLWGF